MFSLRVALRYLFSKRKHGAVNVISTVSVVGVAVATMAIVCVLSVFNGFTDLATAKISLLTPDLRIEPREGKTISNGDSLAAVIAKLPGVKHAAPTVEEHALATYLDKQMPVRIKGVTNAYDSITNLRSIIKEDGGFLLDEDDAGNFATLSVGVALNLGARPGYRNPIKVHVPRRLGRINPANPLSSFRGDTLSVGGVFQTDESEFDADLVIIPLEVSRELLDYDREATAVEASAASGTDVSDLAAVISQAIGNDYIVKDRYRQQEHSYKMISVEKWITFFLLGFILVIASFNIITTLSMLIIEKSDNIATLYTLGATRRMLSRIFILEGWLISLVGGLAGIAVGVALCLAQQYGGFIKLGGDHNAMIIDTYPVRVSPIDLFAVFALVAGIGIITSMITSFIMKKRLS
jgi:ABC-type lipoprotein release transport system permease subunit